MTAAESLELALHACVLVDRTGLTRLRATGPDILDLLHRVSTQDLKGLAVGSGAPTVLTSAKGRIVERLFVHRVAEREVLLIGGAGRAEALLGHIGKYTFVEQTGLSDVTTDTVQYALIGPDAAHRLVDRGIPDPGPHGTRRAVLEGADIVVLGEDGFTSEGRSIVAAARDGGVVQSALAECAPLADAATLDAWRIVRQLPGPGTELNEDWNPLEAGLRDHVSFSKGCYVGQEVVARLNTYDRVSRRLVLVNFRPDAAVPEPPTEIVAGERPIGKITSATRLPDGTVVALGYVKVRDLDRDDVRAGAAEGTIVNP